MGERQRFESWAGDRNSPVSNTQHTDDFSWGDYGTREKKTFLPACPKQMDLGFGAEDPLKIAFLTPAQLLAFENFGQGTFILNGSSFLPSPS